MLLSLPKDIDYLISEYDIDYNTKKTIIIKHKIDLIIKECTTRISNIESIENLPIELTHYSHILQNDLDIKDAIDKYAKNCCTYLKIPKDVIEYKNKQIDTIKRYTLLSSRLGCNILNTCNHSCILVKSDYDYHKPRYEYTCRLCFKNLCNTKIPKNASSKYV